MRSDDLTGLYRPPAPEGAKIRQGVIVTADVLAGTGTVNVGGTILTNVPFLTTAGIAWFVAGDPVVLIVQGSAWFILGRVVKGEAGTVNAIGRNTQAALVGSASASNFALTTGFVTKVTLNLSVPTWAEVATLDVKLQGLAKNSTVAVDFLNAQILMPDGATTAFSSASVPAANWGQITHCAARQVACTPGGTLAVVGQLRSTGGAWAADAAAAAYITCSVVYNSNDGA